jgi:hypothetical protein
MMASTAMVPGTGTYDMVVEVFINFLRIGRRLSLIKLSVIHFLNKKINTNITIHVSGFSASR